ALAGGGPGVSPGLGGGGRKILAEPPARPGNAGQPGTEIEEPVAHENTPGVRTTFIKLGSHACNRANHCGPSSSGATAVISGFTCIAPVDRSSMACGYSPAEAHDPCSRICRVTTFCSGRVTSGEMFPTSTTVPPLRTLSIAAPTVSFLPTASTARSTPTPPHCGNTGAIRPAP